MARRTASGVSGAGGGGGGVGCGAGRGGDGGGAAASSMGTRSGIEGSGGEQMRRDPERGIPLAAPRAAPLTAPLAASLATGRGGARMAGDGGAGAEGPSMARAHRAAVAAARPGCAASWTAAARHPSTSPGRGPLGVLPLPLSFSREGEGRWLGPVEVARWPRVDAGRAMALLCGAAGDGPDDACAEGVRAPDAASSTRTSRAPNDGGVAGVACASSRCTGTTTDLSTLKTGVGGFSVAFPFFFNWRLLRWRMWACSRALFLLRSAAVSPLGGGDCP